ncbi:hypothetical protein EC9_38980 [Rosistilla ulvae]|uniref:Anti-bacteriophage protein A/HamA C-terminal domain-containing protein n=1 Tax=Rosistilla ulvae TaxID=1930277 RepID=A0A517M4B2_9BACT|nr:hypothetical protein EC9_38980 [Rosistilla ulvae]
MSLVNGSYCFDATRGQTSWQGFCCTDDASLSDFLKGPVTERLHDSTATLDFRDDLRALATTQFASDSLELVLQADVPEERDWAIGESFAEAYLEAEHAVSWPWNHERDKRNPFASLPGADLVGFVDEGGATRLALGEVKASTDANNPPGVMNGRSGMRHQLEQLVTNLGTLCQLLKWLHSRCKGTENEQAFKDAVRLLIDSGNQAISLYGVLIRDTPPTVLDLEARGDALSKNVVSPTSCRLVAIYLPFSIAELPSRVGGAA